MVTGGDLQAGEPVVTQGAELVDVGLRERESAVATILQMGDPQFTDGQVQITERTQLRAADMYLRDARRIGGDERRVTAIGFRSLIASTTLRSSSVSNCSDRTMPWRASAVVSRLATPIGSSPSAFRGTI